MCHAPMHYESYKIALRQKFALTPDIPTKPLVVDLGCGPATAPLAIADWLSELKREYEPMYLGVDHSNSLRQIAEKVLIARGFATDSFALSESVASIRDEQISGAASRTNGVIFALSYIVHQAFMSDMTLLAQLMRRVRAAYGIAPTWFLLQDANFSTTIDGITTIWPENRLTRLADLCSVFGYDIDTDKASFRAPHVNITANGDFRIAPNMGTNNVCYFFCKIA
jgi:hypothetical protein